MRRSGFTLIELLVVIFLFGIIIALLLPAIAGGRAAAKRTYCQNNLRQIGAALQIYHHENETFPSGYVEYEDSGRPGWAWSAEILRCLEQTDIAKCINPTLPVMHPDNRTAVVSRLNVFFCKSSEEHRGDFMATSTINGVSISTPLPLTSYVGSFGTGDPDSPAGRGESDGVFYRNSRVSFDRIGDGISTTILVGERTPSVGLASWSGVINGTGTLQAGSLKRFDTLGPSLILGSTLGNKGPNDRPVRASQFASAHPGGAYFAFGDSSVRFIKNEISAPIYHALATRNGGDLVTSDEE